MSNKPRRGRAPRTDRRCRARTNGRCRSAGGADFAAMLAADFAALEGPLQLEQWTSGLLGQVWAERSAGVAAARDERILALGTNLLVALAEQGGRAGRAVLGAIARLDRGPIGQRAGWVRRSRPGERDPEWVEEVGVARIIRALSSLDPEGGEALLLESEPVGNVPHMVCVYIDDRLGGIAKHLHLTGKIDPESEMARGAGGSWPKFKEVDVTLACERVRRAIDLTDRDLAAPVGELFAYYRALVLARTWPAPARIRAS